MIDKPFSDYLAKQSDMWQIECPCGERGYIFVGKGQMNCFSNCRTCGKKIYQVTCSNPKCKTGFSYPDTNKAIDIIKNIWTCEMCHTVNSGLPTLKNRYFHKSEIPLEVFQEEDSRGILPRKTLYLLLAVAAIMYLGYIFLK